MTDKSTALTPAEWNLMECLWERSPRTGREAVEYMERSVGWGRSTTLTMLRRMSEKGLIACGEADGVRVYSPLLAREAAAVRETEGFLGRVYKGSISMMMSAMVTRQELSRQDIDELQAILRQAEVDKK